MDNLLSDLESLSDRKLKKIATSFGIRHGDTREDTIKNIYDQYNDVKKYISYTYIKQLGKEGKDGRTFLALDRNHKEVAIKIFRKNKKASSIEREAKLQAEAAKIGISPKVIEYDGHAKYIVMEKLDSTLFDYFRKQQGQLTLDQQKAVIDLFHKLDKCKIFHGDPNPLNFMEKNGKWYIIDFGFAKPINSKTIPRYGETPNMKYMPLGFKLKLTRIYDKCKLHYIEKYC